MAKNKNSWLTKIKNGFKAIQKFFVDTWNKLSNKLFKRSSPKTEEVNNEPAPIITQPTPIVAQPEPPKPPVVEPIVVTPEVDFIMDNKNKLEAALKADMNMSKEKKINIAKAEEYEIGFTSSTLAQDFLKLEKLEGMLAGKLEIQDGSLHIISFTRKEMQNIYSRYDLLPSQSKGPAL